MGKCLARQNICFKCGKLGHYTRECITKKSMAPGRSGKQRMLTIAQVFSLTLVDATISNDVVTETFPSYMTNLTLIRFA